MPSRPRLLLVSEVLPGPDSAGGMILARHLRDYPDVLAVVPRATSQVSCATAVVGSARLWRFAQARPHNRMVHLLALFGLVHPCRRFVVARTLAAHRPDALVAIAHGETAFLAARVARQARLPLVLLFHDWWPDFVPTRYRGVLDSRFRRLSRRCAAALCVSEEFCRRLDPLAPTSVLAPLSAERPEVPAEPNESAPFEVHYFGNMAGCYRPLLLALLRALDGQDWRLQLAGSAADWTPEEEALAARTGGYQGSVSDAEFDRRRSRAGVFLVVLSFFEGDRRRVETSFPSKLVEYCQTPRPIIVWGPAASAAAQWVRRTGAALLVDRPDPAELIEAVRRLRQDPGRRAELVAAARRQAETVFSPARIRQTFDETLGALCGSRRTDP